MSKKGAGAKAPHKAGPHQAPVRAACRSGSIARLKFSSTASSPHKTPLSLPPSRSRTHARSFKVYSRKKYLTAYLTILWQNTKIFDHSFEVHRDNLPEADGTSPNAARFLNFTDQPQH